MSPSGASLIHLLETLNQVSTNNTQEKELTAIIDKVNLETGEKVQLVVLF